MRPSAEEGLLYWVLDENLETFLNFTGDRLPGFVGWSFADTFTAAPWRQVQR